MRTVFVVMVLVMVALAAGLSFVLKAGAQSPPAGASATLEYRCDGADGLPAIPSGVPTLRTCTATATDTSSTALTGATMTFEPASLGLAVPDSYCFFSAAHDGVDETTSCGNLSYSFGDLDPGAKSVIVLRVIVRSAHEYGADVVLRAGPDAHEYARVQLHGLVTAGTLAPLPAKFYRTDTGAGTGAPGPTAAYHLVVEGRGERYDDVKLELASGASEDSAVRISESDTWVRAGADGHLLRDDGPLEAGSGISRDITFTISDPASGICAYLQPVIVVTAARGGVTDTASVIGENAMVGDCLGVGQGGGGGDSAAFPVTGGGPDAPPRAAGHAREALALGALLLLAGLSMRRVARRRR